MRASTETLLSLEQFAYTLGLDPLHFAGGVSALRPAGAHCHDVWMQHLWQDPGKACREEIARLVAEAEEDIARVAGYWPAPVWTVDEYHPCGSALTARPLASDTPIKIEANWGFIIQGGRMATEELIAENVTRDADVDADGDGFAELAQFTLSNVPDDWDETEIRACFKEFDEADAANCRLDPSSTGYDVRWEVRPLRTSRSGSTITVWTSVWNLFRPQLEERLDAAAIEADDPASYVDTLTFYRVYTDNSQQATFLWAEDGCTDAECAWATQTGCLLRLHRRLSIVQVKPATYDDGFVSASWAQSSLPQGVLISYQSGIAEPRPRWMDPWWARLVVMLACARLEWPVCTCSNVRQLVERWREDAALVAERRSYSFSPADLSNPFGSKVGEILAWRKLNARGLRLGRTVHT